MIAYTVKVMTRQNGQVVFIVQTSGHPENPKEELVDGYMRKLIRGGLENFGTEVLKAGCATKVVTFTDESALKIAKSMGLTEPQ